MTDYEYDPELPYVVENKVVDIDNPLARFRHKEGAEYMAEKYVDVRVIDTTPKPRVPDDAEHVVWVYAGTIDGCPFKDLPGVTPDTVFTVLDERESR